MKGIGLEVFGAWVSDPKFGVQGLVALGFGFEVWLCGRWILD